jgi:uncharacterized protein with ATP-grasp and redox domains
MLKTSDPGSFARSTILERKPRIIQDVILDNDYSPDIIQSLGDFCEEIKNDIVKPLKEKNSDISIWNTELSRFSGCSWLELPWYFAEAYFYRKLLEAVEYFQAGQWLFWNPFHNKKEKQLQSDLNHLIVTLDTIQDYRTDEKCIFLIQAALWGNRTDLSNFNVDEKDRLNWSVKSETGNILIDDSEEFLKLLLKGNNRIDFINDNTGSDIYFDLALSDFLLKNGYVNKVVFHLKNQPFFVSDAMPEDIFRIIDILKQSYTPDQKNGNKSISFILGENINSYLSSGKLTLKEEPFWTFPFMFDQMPTELQLDLSASDLVVIKGDVNYRRLLGDRHWPKTTCMIDVTDYFPASFVTLRTLKGEIIVGLEQEVVENISKIDPAWLINGKRGIIQLVKKNF